MPLESLASWEEPLNYSILNVINSATSSIPKYEVNSGRVGQVTSLSWRETAQQAVLAWISQENPDEEDLRSSLMTIDQYGANNGCSKDELGDIVGYRTDLAQINIAHQALARARQQHSSDSRGRRHFGDAMVTYPREFVSAVPISPLNRTLRLAWSNGCTKPMSYLGKIRSGMVEIPSISYHSQVVPELNPTFDELSHDYHLQTIIWDYARYNKLWQSIVSAISSGPNQDLYHDIMHGRERLQSDKAEKDHIPWEIDGEILVRFLARTEPYDLVDYIWKELDKLCDASPQVAEKVFDQNTSRLLILAENAPSLAELSLAFLNN